MKRSGQFLISTILILALSAVALGGTITGSRSSRSGTITGSRIGTISGSKTGTITGSRQSTRLAPTQNPNEAKLNVDEWLTGIVIFFLNLYA